MAPNTNAATALPQWLKLKGMTARRFATLVRVSDTAIYMYTSCRKRPGLAVAIRIERATSGEVRAADWLTDDERWVRAS